MFLTQNGLEMSFKERRRDSHGGIEEGSSMGAMALKDLPPRLESPVRGTERRLWFSDLRQREGV